MAAWRFKAAGQRGRGEARTRADGGHSLPPGGRAPHRRRVARGSFEKQPGGWGAG